VSRLVAGMTTIEARHCEILALPPSSCQQLPDIRRKYRT
jgi:hypothetical protein